MIIINQMIYIVNLKYFIVLKFYSNYIFYKNNFWGGKELKFTSVTFVLASSQSFIYISLCYKRFNRLMKNENWEDSLYSNYSHYYKTI